MPIIRTCRITGKEFMITEQEIALLDKLTPSIGGERFPIPLPTLCPEERLRRRAQYRNYFFLHKRKCDLTGQDIISTFPKDSKSIIWNQKDWWTDQMDGLAYGEEIDWNKDFFSQCQRFMQRVPHVTLDNAYKELVNSEFVSGNGNSKDCYLTSNGNENEKCLYGFFIHHDRYVMNSIYTRFSENCSFSAYIWKCFNLHFSYNSEECRDSWYAFSCIGCQNILGCVGLKNENYRILNTPCSEEEYRVTLKKLQTEKSFRLEFEEQFKDLRERIGIEQNITTGSIDTTGDYCYDSKNTHASYNSAETEDSWYINDCFEVGDSMDITSFGDNLSLSYDSIGVGGNSSHLYWCQGSWSSSSYQFYCHNCFNSSYLFGCSGLHHKSYCIFNKQYTKEDWESNVKKLVSKMQQSGEWGEFWDAKDAWYPYDASFAMMILPLSKTEVLDRGLEWSDYELSTEGVTKSIPAEKLPFDIREIPDNILTWAIICEKTGKPFKIQKLELEMHRTFGIPLPHLHPFERIEKLFDWSKRKFSFDF